MKDWSTVIALDCGAHHTVLLSSDSQIIAWGRNGYGQLGVGDFEDRHSPTLVPPFLPEGSTDKIIKVRSGSFFSAAITETGELWTWGDNSKGALGIGQKFPSAFSPLRVPFPGAVQELAGGRDHALAISKDGKLYVWGNNSSGELGIGDQFPKFEPTLNPLEDVVEIACGLYHSCAITKSGKLFVFGASGSDTSLGIPDVWSVSVPTHLELPGVPKKIACGGYQNFVTLEDGSLVGWGGNYGMPQERVETPTRIVLPVGGDNKKIIFVGCGYDFTTVIFEDGVFYCFGSTVKLPDTMKLDLVFPRDSIREIAWTILRWLFLGKSEPGSFFFGLPVEILFHMVYVLAHPIS
jgi:alpha-tubulin suppressor-like RCC1 family protein